MDDVTFMILKLVISVCAALVTAYVIPYLKTLKNNKRYSTVIDMVSLAVRAAEQTITDPKSGALKKAKVMQFTNRWLKTQGISISEEELNDLIESAVYQMKQE